MNSEELEISLRTEFETYLKDVFADVRQEISQLQSKIETELENYKSQLDVVFKDSLNRAESGADFDAGFKDSVLEHLRLARDEGARITATAFAEAEDMNNEAAAKIPGIKELHAAVNDISSKDSQGEILKTLVHHASQFAARGAFFIVKKEHFVAWRTFDSENASDEETVHEVFLPISADSVLSESVRSLSTVESNSETYPDDAAVLEKLGFGSPEKMFAIPLIARGRGVAVLYVDRGAHESGSVNVEALETMVRVAGLTVEILASVRGDAKKKVHADYAEDSSVKASAEPAQAETGFAPAYQTPAAEQTESFSEDYRQPSETDDYDAESSSSAETQPNESHSNESYSDESTSNEQIYAVEPEEVKPEFVSESYSDNYSDKSESAETPVYQDTENEVPQTEVNYPTYDDKAWSQPAENETPAEVNYSDAESVSYEAKSWDEPEQDTTPVVSAQEYADNFVKEAVSDTQNYSFEPAVESEPQPDNKFSAYQTNQYNFEQPENKVPQSFVPQTETYAPVAPETDSSKNPVAKPWGDFAEPAAPPVSTTPVKSRLSERNVDLPIEVSEDERRLHNDARRFARLLVSEIKLYNEQKVKEGREANDLYERLREAIDRSREMYDKRVQPPVAAKFDYFHYELVNTLAEGDSNKLGVSYPNTAV